MTTPNPTFNPIATSVAAGSFNIQTTGYIQGTALDQPAIRNSLAGGYLYSSETVPMWGGLPISENIPGVAGQPNSAIGGPIIRATNITPNTAGCVTGISVFDQNYSAVNSPQSPVPLTGTGMQVNFYRLGSGARIAVPCVDGLSALEGGIITQLVSWDFTSSMLVPYEVAFTAVTITGAVWANTSGGQTTFTVGTDLTAKVNAGDIINVSGVVNTGGTSTAAFNGQFVVVSVTSTTIVVVQLASVSPGTYASGGTIAAAGGAFPVSVLDVQVGNSMVVSYDSTTGFATWNRSGSCAIILI